jgi:hypothetical protein
MARDAIARQYDVDKNTMILVCEKGKGGYLPGTISFEAKKGKSIDITKIRESITATRLSGGTNMGVTYLEITATGTAEARDKELSFKVAGTGQQFNLVDHANAKGVADKLREALARGDKVTSIIGRVQGWSGRFPDVLRAQAKAPAIQTLELVDFQTTK